MSVDLLKELKKKLKRKLKKEEEVICPSQKQSKTKEKLQVIASPRDKITGADFKKLKKKKKKNNTKNVPTTKAIYARVKAEAKRNLMFIQVRMQCWLVKTYKKRGGGYTTKKK